MCRKFRLSLLMLALAAAAWLGSVNTAQAGPFYHPYRGYAYGGYGPAYYGGYRAYGAGPYVYRAPVYTYAPYRTYQTYGYGPYGYNGVSYGPYNAGVYTPFGGVTTYSSPYGGVGIGVY